MTVEVDVAILQGWITIGIVGFGSICSATVVGIRLVTKPMIKALNDLNTTVTEINKDRALTDKRVTRLETVHEMRGCNQPIEGDRYESDI